jgi:hypothetical protein
MRFVILFSGKENPLFINNFSCHFSGKAAAGKIRQRPCLAGIGIRTAEVDQPAISASQKSFSNHASPHKTRYTLEVKLSYPERRRGIFVESGMMDSEHQSASGILPEDQS